MTVVARGSLRVDARRAVAKLREHQLLDRDQYLHEITRAAVAFGATELALAWDADDLSLTWTAPELPRADALERLLDWVLSPARDRETRRLRLLARGVNAALGLDPAFVDAIVVAPDGAVRLRWTPALVGDEGARPVRERLREAPLPPGSMRVQVRRRIGLEMLRRAVLETAPREVGALLAATEHLRAPLHVHGETERRRSPRALLRRALQLDEAAGKLELMAADFEEPAIEMLEHQVLLARYPLRAELVLAEPGAQLAQQPLPLRAVIDAELLPTNASRSAVREDSALFVAAHEAIRAGAAELLAALAAPLGDTAGIERLDADDGAIAEALGAIVSVAARLESQGATLLAAAARLLELPLFQNGCGQPCSYRALQAAGTVYLHRESTPLPPDLAPWLDGVVWLRGRRAEGALLALPTADAAPRIAEAQRGAARREALLAHAPVEVALAPSPEHLAREAFSCTSGALAGLHGEVALLRAPPGTRPSTARIFWQRRPLSLHEIPPSRLPIALELAIGWDERLQPRLAMDSVHEDAWFHEAVRQAALVAVALLERLAGEISQLGEREELLPLLHAAVATAVLHAPALTGGLRQPLPIASPLWTAPLWPTSEPGRRTSLAALHGYADRAGAICAVGPLVRGRAPDGRPVLALAAGELDWALAALAAARSAALRVVPYERAIGVRTAARRHALATAVDRALAAQGLAELPLWPKLAIERAGLHALVAPGTSSRRFEHHAAELLGDDAVELEAPTIIAFDLDSTIPQEAWDMVLWREAPPLAELERELCAAVVAALGGDAEAQARIGWTSRPTEIAPELVTWLVHAASTLDDERDGALLDQLVSLPMLTLLDQHGEPSPASLADLASAHPAPKPIPLLTKPPGFATWDWRPLLVPHTGGVPRADLWAALERWSGGRIAIVSARELERRRDPAVSDAPLRDEKPAEAPVRARPRGRKRAPTATKKAPPPPVAAQAPDPRDASLRALAALERADDPPPPPAAAPAAPPTSSSQPRPKAPRRRERRGDRAAAQPRDGAQAALDRLYEQTPLATRHEVVESWLEGVTRRVLMTFTGEPKVADPPPVRELLGALARMLASLSLAGAPVSEIAWSQSGRPVRYQAKQRRLLLNREHALVRAIGRRPLDPLAVALLAASAVGEINRALGEVTDAEELRALGVLMATRPRS